MNMNKAVRSLFIAIVVIVNVLLVGRIVYNLIVHHSILLSANIWNTPAIIDVAFIIYFIECELAFICVFFISFLPRWWFAKILLAIILLPIFVYAQIVFLLMGIYCENCAGDSAFQQLSRFEVAFIPGLILIAFTIVLFLGRKIIRQVHYKSANPG